LIIGTAAYKDLINILKHPQFCIFDLPNDLSTVKKYRNKLPLMPISSLTVPILQKNTPSNSEATKEAYYFSILNHIERVLNNPQLKKHTYFGAGVEVTNKRELWHGTLWHESPLFGLTSISYNDGKYNNNILKHFIYFIVNILNLFQVIYSTGEFVMYEFDNVRYYGRILAFIQVEENGSWRIKIQKLLNYFDLPRIFRSASRGTDQLWMTDDFILIKRSQIIKKVVIWLEDTDQIPRYEKRISEILYKHNNRYTIRPIEQRHHHPNEYITMGIPPSPNMKVFKFFIDLYYDDFGTFRTVYHSLGGLYVQFGNMTLKLRQQLKNHFLIGFVPFGGEFKDVIKPFIKDIKQLQHGIVMKIGEEEVWVTGGLGLTTADLPQGNDLAGILRQNANYGCRTCEVFKENLTEIDYDIKKHGRYHHLTDNYFDYLHQLHDVPSLQTAFAKEHGLCIKPNVLDQLFRDRHTQTPQDAFHAVAGLGGRLLNITLESFTRDGEAKFLTVWKSFEFPSYWTRQQNPISHRNSYFMSDTLRLAIMMPFLLRRCLNNRSIKDNIIQRIKENNQLRLNSQAISMIKQCWIKFAICSKAVFAESMSDNDYVRLDATLQNLSIDLLKVKFYLVIRFYSSNY
jgi:hypothetical protein